MTKPIIKNLFPIPIYMSNIDREFTKKGTNTRVSLAFNTFYKGVLGSNYNSTELVI